MIFENAVETGMGYSDIQPKELWAKRASVKIVDVRQPDEYHGKLGHIPGAELIVLDTIPAELHRLPKDSTLVFVCHSGGRSGRAAAFAASQGYEHAFNMAGGMLAWNECGLEVEK